MRTRISLVILTVALAAIGSFVFGTAYAAQSVGTPLNAVSALGQTSPHNVILTHGHFGWRHGDHFWRGRWGGLGWYGGGIFASPYYGGDRDDYYNSYPNQYCYWDGYDYDCHNG